jgi:O-antigen ligase
MLKKIFCFGKLHYHILAVMPFSLFFPIGIMYVLTAIFLIALFFSGDFVGKMANIRCSPVFYPAVALCMWSLFSALFVSDPKYQPFFHLLHYQIYLILLLLISAGAGSWQKKAIVVFLGGAVYGASLFFLTRILDFPAWDIFKNYVNYQGNKSVSLGIFLALAASISLLLGIRAIDRSKQLLYAAIYIYVAAAVLFFAKTRSGHLALIVSSLLVILMNIKYERRTFLWPLVFIALISISWKSSDLFKNRTTQLFDDLIVFSKGGKPSFEAARLEFFVHTGEMIAERPLLGHGVGAWRAQYPERAKNLITAEMSAPHNDYLLYWAELGLPGLLILIWIWASMLRAAKQLDKTQGQILILLTVATIVGGMTNTVLRDWRFGVPMMILTATVLAGFAGKNQTKPIHHD